MSDLSKVGKVPKGWSPRKRKLISQEGLANPERLRRKMQGRLARERLMEREKRTAACKSE